MRIGIMTGGGDAPGLNAVIEYAARTLLSKRVDVVGVCDGFLGVLEQRTRLIRSEDLEGLHQQAGTFLGTTNREGIVGRENEFIASFKILALDGLIIAGGDGTFRQLEKVLQLPLIGLPKTIDNDLAGSDLAFGFDTACTVVAEALDALRATAEAHRRVIVVEAMGRTAGWIALRSGLAACADAIVLPELEFSIDSLRAHLKQRVKQRSGAIVVIAEGATGGGGATGAAERLARELGRDEALEARHVVLGHLQRARGPTVADRMLALNLATRGAQLALEKRFGQAVVWREGSAQIAPIKELCAPPRVVPNNHALIQVARDLGIFI